jgi:pimeloyl-ACP methyl ester carboxylesterase
VVCVPGLSANQRSFDVLGAHLGQVGWQVIAIDLRGRGRSPATEAGSHGWGSHARDVLAVGAELGHQHLSIVGHSMGAAVALTAVGIDAGKHIDKVILIDFAGRPEPSSLGPIGQSVERLGRVHGSADEFMEEVRAIGSIAPWDDHWEAHFRYELEEVRGGVRQRTSREAVLEDVAYGGAVDPYLLWPSLTMRTLLLRAARPILPGLGHILTAADFAEFSRVVPRAYTIEVDANHYGIVMHEDAVRAIERFLAEE